ncbi:MAG TPA: helix-turn-helix domain-containing protein [Solirubrobacterales bacterium]|nr:helix-turn-helix domain-containing protein [Solirubrobacterales bacterium]
MEKELLEQCLAEGLSLEAIGRRVGKHESTVSYWLKKHGLAAAGSQVHAPNGKVDPGRLQMLVEEGASIQRMGETFGVGRSTIRYWLRKLGLETERAVRLQESQTPRAEGRRRVYLRCQKHGHTAFYARPEGGFRCGRCSSAAVSKRRKYVKKILVEEAGGCCALCGFAEHPAALQFHHLDPSTKSFSLGEGGLTRSLESLRAEAKKCVLLCANCHAQVEVGAKSVVAKAR